MNRKRKLFSNKNKKYTGQALSVLQTIGIIFLISLTSFVFSHCKKKSPYITKKEIEKLSAESVRELKEVRNYNVSSSPGLENVALYNTAKGSEIGIFRPLEESYEMIWKKVLPAPANKMVFVNSGLPWSHIMVLTGGDKKDLLVLGSEGFEQSFSNVDPTKIFLRKDSHERDILLVGDSRLQYNSFEYAERMDDHPFFFMQPVLYNGDDSEIIIENRGSYTTRALFTISFPDLDAKNYQEFVELNRKIDTVKLYRPGVLVHRKDTGKISARYPTIEILKQPFASGAKIRLPLKLKKEAGKMQVRAVYTYHGGVFEWPESSETLDQQNYPVYIREVNE